MISARIGADFSVILRESALFARGYKLVSLWDCPMSDHCQGVYTAGTMGCALVRGSPRDSRGDSGFESYITEKSDRYPLRVSHDGNIILTKSSRGDKKTVDNVRR
jgi:hypothetical protein